MPSTLPNGAAASLGHHGPSSAEPHFQATFQCFMGRRARASLKRL